MKGIVLFSLNTIVYLLCKTATCFGYNYSHHQASYNSKIEISEISKHKCEYLHFILLDSLMMAILYSRNM